MPYFKRCFNCQNVRYINQFTDNNKKYQRPAAKGKNQWCKPCLKRRLKDKGY